MAMKILNLETIPSRASGGGRWPLRDVDRVHPETLSYEDSFFWLVVSTHLKNFSQNGNLPQIGMKIENI